MVSDYEDEGLASSRPAVGYSVCDRCFADEDIATFIESVVEFPECDFCGRKNRTKNIAAPLDSVVDFMLEAIDREYERAVDALGFESAEGGYQGAHWDSWDLIERIGVDLPNDDGRLLKILVDCLGDEPWCDRNPYAQREDKRLVSSWERFSKFIKYKRRYFFFEDEDEDELVVPHEHLSPAELLSFIGETVTTLDLVRTLRAGSLLYRARQQKAGENLRNPYDFAPPPVERALRSNRMSPAGVVMFYGSDDPKTAQLEIDDDPKLGIVVGTFRTLREAKVLELARLPRQLGFFERQPDSSEVNRYALAFLHSFVARVAAKVEPGDREHIDYVPTQVVTEWFRTIFHVGKSSLDGIIYPSTQNPGGRSLVLFANRYSVFLSEAEMKRVAIAEKTEEWMLRGEHERAWLKLVRRRLVRSAT